MCNLQGCIAICNFAYLTSLSFSRLVLRILLSRAFYLIRDLSPREQSLIYFHGIKNIVSGNFSMPLWPTPCQIIKTQFLIIKFLTFLRLGSLIRIAKTCE